MNNTEIVEITNLCMICNGTKVLVQDKNSKDSYKGLSLPGGSVNPDENFNKAVIRCMKEEVGLDVERPKLCGIKEWSDGNIRHITLLYKVDKYSGIERSTLFGRVLWMELDELLKAPNLSVHTASICNVIKSDNLSELIFFKENDLWYTMEV